VDCSVACPPRQHVRFCFIVLCYARRPCTQDNERAAASPTCRKCSFPRSTLVPSPPRSRYDPPPVSSRFTCHPLDPHNQNSPLPPTSSLSQPPQPSSLPPYQCFNLRALFHGRKQRRPGWFLAPNTNGELFVFFLSFRPFSSFLLLFVFFFLGIMRFFQVVTL